MISYENLEVVGLPFGRIREIQIRQRAGEHGYAVVVGEMAPKDAKSCAERVDETSKIVIKSKKEPKLVLFVGAVTRLEASLEAQFSQVRIEAATVSSLLDIRRRSASFQNTKKKYGEILQAALKPDQADIEFKAKDKAISKPVIQLDETNWEFARRIAGAVGTLVFAPIAAEKPHICIGRAQEAHSGSLKSAEYTFTVDNAAWQRAVKAVPKGGKTPLQQDFATLSVESPEYLYIGDKLTVNQQVYYVKSMRAKLFREGLIMNYELAGATAFLGQPAKTPGLAGRMLMGQVKDVKEDRVRVHLLELDEQYDKDTQWWFPYATAYSSSDGSGWYVMPEKGDYVRILFPSADPEQAFAASTVNTAPGQKPGDKRFKAPKGKELLLTDKGIYIICDHQKIFLDLTDRDGIRLVSASDIQIVSKANITLQAGQDVQVLAKKQVLLGTPGAAVTITPSKITMAAKSITLT